VGNSLQVLEPSKFKKTRDNSNLPFNTFGNQESLDSGIDVNRVAGVFGPSPKNSQGGFS